jgi:threonine synthase
MLRAQRDLAEMEGLWVETSSALSVATLPALVQSGAIDPDSVVVAVLTSSGLKDPEVTASVLSEIPSVDATFESALNVLSSSYSFDPAHPVRR